MKKILSLALTAIITFASGVSAQIFWKVEKPGSDKTSYLLGTHHFAYLSTLDSLAQLPAALEKCDRLYGELDMEAMTSPENIMKMQQVLVAPSDSTLDKVLTPAQLDSLKTVWNDLTGGQAPLEMMYAMKPSLLSTQIASIMAMKIFPDLNPLEGLDMTMQKRAKDLGKPVAGLETIDFQMDRLYGTPIKKQAESLMETIRDMEGQEKMSKQLADAYMRHDLDTILKTMEEEEESAEDLERLLYSRNDNWVKQLAEEMPGESIFVVVGVGHLPGDRGVIAQLRKAGFTVTPAE
ncbi:MAG: TraB/GumN family protein [Muribaculaceae bacterium]|nr:TraB/GumN family protein [Muribaculaceae bacterium]